MGLIKKRNSYIKIGVILFTLATAFIHLGLAVSSSWPFNLLFALNGLGYLALLSGFYLKLPVVYRVRDLVWLLFILFTLTTIGLFFIMNTTYGAFGLITKAVEGVLVILLIMEKPGR
jgi:hypothetical protein